MQPAEQDTPTPKKRPKSGCLHLLAAFLLVCFALAAAAFACLIVLDPGPVNEDGSYPLSQRMKRYKVAGQFIWADIKGRLSGQSSKEPPPENDPFF